LVAFTVRWNVPTPVALVRCYQFVPDAVDYVTVLLVRTALEPRVTFRRTSPRHTRALILRVPHRACLVQGRRATRHVATAHYPRVPILLCDAVCCCSTFYGPITLYGLVLHTYSDTLRFYTQLRAQVVWACHRPYYNHLTTCLPTRQPLAMICQNFPYQTPVVCLAHTCRFTTTGAFPAPTTLLRAHAPHTPPHHTPCTPHAYRTHPLPRPRSCCGAAPAAPLAAAPRARSLTHCATSRLSEKDRSGRIPLLPNRGA